MIENDDGIALFRLVALTTTGQRTRRGGNCATTDKVGYLPFEQSEAAWKSNGQPNKSANWSVTDPASMSSRAVVICQRQLSDVGPKKQRRPF